MADRQHVTYECTKQSFRPYLHHEARWLDPEGDFEMVRAFWPVPLSRQDWLSFWADGYQYAAVFEEGRIVSLAAAWHYSDNASELAAVGTPPDQRLQGFAKSVCSFITQHILGLGLRATCTTMADNAAMRATAEAIGYVEVHEPDEEHQAPARLYGAQRGYEADAGPDRSETTGGK